MAATGVQAASIVGSKHDISTAGTQVCIHCHTPHNASTQDGLKDGAPLWNRRITDLDAFIPYSSPTMTQTCATRPSGISLACLSCHDGTVSGGMGSAVNPTPTGDQHNKINEPTSGGGSSPDCMKCHWTVPADGIYSKALTVMAGPDLRNDHPISMLYPVGNTSYNVPADAKGVDGL